MQEFCLPRLHIERLDRAIATPSGPNTSEELHSGAIYRSDGKLLSSSMHRRRDINFTADAADSIDASRVAEYSIFLSGTSIYLGWIFNHYGHFLLESLSRYWSLDTLNMQDNWNFLFHSNDIRTSTQDEFFELLSLIGIPLEKVILLNSTYLVESLIVPNQQAVLNRGISQEILSMYQNIAQIVSCEIKGNTPKKIYVSRRKLPVGSRKIATEATIEREHIAEGYAIIHPQTMPLKSQIATFAGAKEISGPEGTALHNILFALAPGSMRIYTTPDGVRKAINQAYLNSAKGCDSEIIVVEDEGTKV